MMGCIHAIATYLPIASGDAIAPFTVAIAAASMSLLTGRFGLPTSDLDRCYFDQK